MALRLCFFCLIYGFALSWSAEAAEPQWRGPWKGGVSELVPWLEAIPEGREILRAAKEKDPDFLSKVTLGKASFTETNFVRTYSLLDGKENVRLRHSLTLNRSLSLGDAVVDFAHELIHATEKGMLDPYGPGFLRKDFVRNGIEGPGGELAALEKECEVAWALREKFPLYPSHRLCGPYRNETGGFDRKKALADYYAVGAWYDKLPRSVQSIPGLSRRSPVLSSSYAKKPYPVALSEEYDATLAAACTNNRRKYRLIAAQAEDGGRRPASGTLRQEKERLRAYEARYCPPIKGGIRRER